MRRILVFVAKAIASVSLLYLSLIRVDLGVVVTRLNQIDLRWLSAALAMLAISTILGALRWRQIVNSCNTAGRPCLSNVRALRYAMVGAFFNQTLPSTVGGDAMRIWLLVRDRIGWGTATYSVIIDRFAGLLALSLLVLAGLPWSLDLITNLTGRATLLIVGFGSIAACLAFLGLGIISFSWMSRWWMIRHLHAAAHFARKIFSEPINGVQVGGYSLFIHLSVVTAAWFLAKATAAPLQWTQALFVVLPVMLITTVPLSIAGWGVRETAMIVAFGYAGLQAGDGLIISVLLGISGFAIGLLGGVLWLLPMPGPPDDSYTHMDESDSNDRHVDKITVPL